MSSTTSYYPNSVSETTGLRNKGASNFWKKIGCHGGADGFTVISSGFFVLTVAVNFALVIQIYYGNPEITPHGAVATDEGLCSQIGREAMSKGGTSADVVIASLFCLSVTHPHLAGPGGGGVALVHDHKLNRSRIYDFMTGVPFGLEGFSQPIDSNDGRSIGIPGFLRGLEILHHRHGRLSWQDLILPSITLARNGFPVSQSLWNELSKEQFDSNSKMGKIFLRRGVLVAQDEILRRSSYAELLVDIALNGVSEFYEHKYTHEILAALTNSGSNVSLNDLQTYEVVMRDPLSSEIRNRSVVTVGTPFGGMQSMVGLKFMEKAKIGPYWQDTKLYEMFAQGISYGNSETQNYIFGGPQSSKLSDDKMKEKGHKGKRSPIKFSEHSNDIFFKDLPATQVSVIDTGDLYITAIVGLGTNFGSRVVTEHEIFLNNHLSSFLRVPQLNDNSAEGSKDSTPHKHLRPFTPYTPMVIMDANNVCGQRIVLSSASSSAIMQVASNLLFRGAEITAAIVEPRISVAPAKEILVNDHQPSAQRLSGEVREYFKARNYTVGLSYIPVSVNAVSKHGDEIVSHSDTRGGGVAARLNGMRERNHKNIERRNHTFEQGKSNPPVVGKVVASVPSNIATIKVPEMANAADSLL